MIKTTLLWLFKISTAIVLLIFFLFLIKNYWPESHWRPLQHQLEKKYGITITLDDVKLPASFRMQNARYRLTFPFERASVLNQLSTDLSHYPVIIIKANLKEIVILRSLELNGLPYGGTYDLASDKLFIDSGWLGDDGSSKEAMGLHHEFSSILMHRHPEIFISDDWIKLNPKNYKYQFFNSSSANLMTDKLDLVGSQSTWEHGFLCNYGKLTLEDDINTFAQYLVAKKEHWPELMSSYPMLASKMQLLTRWYCRIGYSSDTLKCSNSR